MVVAAPPTELDRQTVLLLCCHFGQFGPEQINPLSVAEYNSVAKRLKESGLRPHHLLERRTLLDWLASEPKINGDRLKALLERGALMGLVLERWQAIGLWAICRFEEEYPTLLKRRLREKAPPLLFGVGNRSVLHQGGLAIVGSRNADDEALEYTQHLAETCARDGWTVISGGAKGVDRTAMLGCCEAGGVSVGVMADSLVKAAVSSCYRSQIRDGRLTLITPFDPETKWMASRAMQRNKHVYCLADAGLVVSSDVKGGTWAGATEALESDWHVPVYIRMSGTLPPGNSSLLQRGALRFPAPPWPTSLYHLAGPEEQPVKPVSAGQEQLGLFGQDQVKVEVTSRPHISKSQSSTSSTRSANGSYGHLTDKTDQMNKTEDSPSLDAYTAILPLLLHVLEKPRGIKEVASTINVKQGQAKAWLQRALEEEHVEFVKKKYVAIKS